MAISFRKRFLIAVVALIEIALIVAGLIHRQNFSRDFALVSGKNFDKSAIWELLLDSPSFPTFFETVEVLGFQVASTGRVYEYKLKDANTGEELGIATVLDTVTRDRDDPDNLKRLPLIIQLVSSGNPDRNILPWVLKKAAELRPLNLNGETKPLSDEKIAQIFPRGTVWVFVPFLDTDMEELQQIVEYSSYARRYYGGAAYPGIEDLVKESPDYHPLLGKASKPILLLDTFFAYIE